VLAAGRIVWMTDRAEPEGHGAGTDWWLTNADSTHAQPVTWVKVSGKPELLR
jgi:hypothetical protein